MKVTSSDDIKRLGSILSIWAHPDDETFGMGGILAVAAKNGQRIACLTATRGEGGVRDESRWPAARLGEIRTQELRKAMSVLGIQNQHFLGYVDGCCAQADKDVAISKIAAYIAAYKPDSIFTFGPEGMTGHPDHQTVSIWAGRALKQSGRKARLYHAVVTPQQYKSYHAVDEAFNIFFNIDKPPVCEPKDTAICIELDNWQYQKKIAALQAMPSQFSAMFEKFSAENLRPCLGVESFVLTELD